MIQEPCWPQRFHHQQLPLHYCADPTLAEQPLFDRARDGEAVAQLWQAPQGFVVPGSYRKFAELPAVSEQFASRGWPVYHSLGEAAEPIYLFLCGLLQRTLSTFGVASHFQAVSGSFCDGRYNLACGEGGQVRKIAGTAQYWRPMPAGRGHVVLAHAVILLDVELQAAHRAANDFEARLGSGRVYRAEKTVTLAELVTQPADLLPRFREALVQELQNIS
ncbi:lipoate-protein ligase A [Klebsiella oxytoca]|uniref:hypothetical protein n=1 Tax=Klebsiella oxytoca TaxID=571 RepID=UPI0007CCA6DA|nr:hypothetical protein [Klebsiella oxytoca]SBL25608.1 lipoate-protein ligase A [Klebsiella oxytoca]